MLQHCEVITKILTLLVAINKSHYCLLRSVYFFNATLKDKGVNLFKLALNYLN